MERLRGVHQFDGELHRFTGDTVTADDAATPKVPRMSLSPAS
jgi:hypothetical protein